MPQTPILPARALFGLMLAAVVAAAILAPAASAQAPAGQVENVRMDYAKVLRVAPIYQTLRATRMEQHCDAPDAPAVADEGKGLSRIVGAVKGALAREPEPAASTEKSAGKAGANCRMVPVVREFRRPIAYDVDYVYRDMKYRTRLPYDPGTRLRVRVSVVPYPSQAAER